MKKVRTLKQKLQGLKNKVMKKIPLWANSVISNVAMIIVCALAVEAICILPLMSSAKILLAVSMGRWGWAIMEKAAKKLKEMR